MMKDQLRVLESRMKPCFSLPVDMIPESKEWKVGEYYTIDLKVKQKAMEEDMDGKLRVTFEVESVEGEDEESDGLISRVEKLERESDSYETA